MPDETPHPLPGSARAEREQFAARLHELEEFMQKSVDEGEAMPPAATEMIARLREIVAALDGLTGSVE